MQKLALMALIFLLGACQAQMERSALSVDEAAFLKQADTALALGQTDEALNAYAEAAALSKGAVRAHLELAAIHKQRGNYGDAKAVLRKAHRLNSHSVEVLKELAHLLLIDGEQEEAGQVIRRGLALSAGDVRLLNAYGVWLDRAGEHAQAQEQYRRALESAVIPLDKEYTVNNYALSLIASDDAKDAVSLLEKQLPGAQNPASIRQALALAYGVLGDEATAKKLAAKDLNAAEVEENLHFYRQYREGLIDRRSLFGAPAAYR